MIAAQRGYSEAIDALNSLQSNAATIEAIRKSGKTVNELNEPEMVEYLARIGHPRSALDRLNALHITGTKGKGSTASFCDTLLRQFRKDSSNKIGLYTSPHMIAARERIRIDGVPLSEETFARYFWEVWDSLDSNCERRLPATPLRPVYFRFMTLMAFHVFISEKVAATLLEVGIGGMYDSTNIVEHPVVTGVTPLGLDHTAILGNTIEEIAFQKAGIFKPNAPAITASQPESALRVLQHRAETVQAAYFQVVKECPKLEHVNLGLPGAHQRANASLAIALVQAFAKSDAGKLVLRDSGDALRLDVPNLSADLIKALETAFWPGRCQRVDAACTAGATYFLDGAHTIESIQFSAKWYLDQVKDSKQTKALIFNCTNMRSGSTLLGALLDEITKQYTPKEALTFFRRVYFCTNTTFADGGSASDLVSRAVDASQLASLSLQRELLQTWCSLLQVPAHPVEQLSVGIEQNSSLIRVVPSIEHAMRDVQEAGHVPDVFVVGSLHLVGGVMAHLQNQGMLDDRLASIPHRAVSNSIQ
ncbi:tetrahydrofolate synthase [Malassezia yamatoensis]|uniref:Folylpolyglutamate synthase n=1 Tax=Malassezia yamatoensis TaxID=253288 RepID=A0AAJ6CGV7_9BASI|nr:tetrahydrofolate synthase [Malassezia yamatoensis]